MSFACVHAHDPDHARDPFRDGSPRIRIMIKSMSMNADLFRSLTREQRNTFVACFLGWALDALDFFLVTFVLTQIAQDFNRSIPQVAFSITLTLMLRPLR